MTSTLQEEYLAMKFFLHTYKQRYGTLVANTQNDFVIGIDNYPKMVNKAYDMLFNFINLNKAHGNDNQDSGMSFYLAKHKGQEYGRRIHGRHVQGQDQAKDNANSINEKKNTYDKDKNKDDNDVDDDGSPTIEGSSV